MCVAYIEGLLASREVQSNPHVIDGHGLLIKNYIRGYTTARGTPTSTIKGPLIRLKWTAASQNPEGPLNRADMTVAHIHICSSQEDPPTQR